MGQQESHAPAPSTADTPPHHPQATPPTTPKPNPGRRIGRMDKILKRAQSNLEAKFRRSSTSSNSENQQTPGVHAPKPMKGPMRALPPDELKIKSQSGTDNGEENAAEHQPKIMRRVRPGNNSPSERMPKLISPLKASPELSSTDLSPRRSPSSPQNSPVSPFVALPNAQGAPQIRSPRATSGTETRPKNTTAEINSAVIRSIQNSGPRAARDKTGSLQSLPGSVSGLPSAPTGISRPSSSRRTRGEERYPGAMTASAIGIEDFSGAPPSPLNKRPSSLDGSSPSLTRNSLHGSNSSLSGQGALGVIAGKSTRIYDSQEMDKVSLKSNEVAIQGSPLSYTKVTPVVLEPLNNQDSQPPLIEVSHSGGALPKSRPPPTRVTHGHKPADESRPDEMIGPDLLMPVVAQEDVGLSPIDENRESQNAFQNNAVLPHLESNNNVSTNAGKSETKQAQLSPRHVNGDNANEKDISTLTDISKDLKDEFSKLTEQLSKLDLNIDQQEQKEKTEREQKEEENEHHARVMAENLKRKTANSEAEKRHAESIASQQRRHRDAEVARKQFESKDRSLSVQDDDEDGFTTDTAGWSLGHSHEISDEQLGTSGHKTGHELKDTLCNDTDVKDHKTDMHVSNSQTSQNPRSDVSIKAESHGDGSKSKNASTSNRSRAKPKRFMSSPVDEMDDTLKESSTSSSLSSRNSLTPGTTPETTPATESSLSPEYKGGAKAKMAGSGSTNDVYSDVTEGMTDSYQSAMESPDDDVPVAPAKFEMTQSLYVPQGYSPSRHGYKPKALSSENVISSPLSSPRSSSGTPSTRSPRSPRNQHKQVDTNYKLSTSARVYSAETSSTTRRKATSLSSSFSKDLDVSPMASPRSREKRIGSDMDISTLELESIDKLRTSYYKKHRRRARYSSEGDIDNAEMDESVESDDFEDLVTQGRIMVTDLDKAAFDFTRQKKFLLTDSNVLGGESSSDLDPKLKSEKFSHHRAKFELAKERRPHKLRGTSKNKKRARYTSEESFFGKRSTSGETSPTSPTFVPAPPSRSISLDNTIFKPEAVPEKLDFRELEKFEGHMLVSWLCSVFNEDHYLHNHLSQADMRVMCVQFCTHLMAAGVVKRLEDTGDPDTAYIFKPDYMYCWAHSEPIIQQLDNLPGKLSLESWPPLQALLEGNQEGEKKPDAEQVLGNAQAMIMNLKREMKEEIARISREHEVTGQTLRRDHTVRETGAQKKIGHLQAEVEKYKILAGIESLTHEALWEAGQGDGEESKLKGVRRKTVDVAVATDDAVNKVEKAKCDLNTLAVQTDLSGDIAMDVTDSSRVVNTLHDHSKVLSEIVPPPGGLPQPPGAGPPPAPPPPPPGGIPPPPLPSIGIPPPPPPPPGGVPPPLPPPLGGVPPPPPPPGGVPAPPPPPGGVPPPPPPGAGPPPPPPVGVCGSPMIGSPAQVAAVIRKPAMSPRSPMKPLFWKRILVENIPKRVVEINKRNVFGKTSKTAIPLDSLWEHLEEPEINSDELEEVFSKMPIRKKQKTEQKPLAKKTKVEKILEPKRSQAVGILISSLRLSAVEIENALLSFDASILSQETLQALYDQRPDATELAQIKKHVDKQSNVGLDRPEQFLYDLSQIPSYTDRCSCLIFQSTFTEQLVAVESRLNNVKTTCQTLTMGDKVKTILGLVLAIGNYMNGGTSRGQADGFGLEILAKLKDVKSKDNSRNLLQYVVSQYVRKYENIDTTTGAKAVCPLPEPSDVCKAADLNFEDIEKELRNLSDQLKACNRRVTKVIEGSTEDNVEPFRTIMRRFVETAKVDIKEQETNMEDVKKRFEHCCVFFTVLPKPQETAVVPRDFFSLWSGFCEDFKNLYKREHQRIIKEKVREAEKRVKQIQRDKSFNKTATQPTSKTGLKAKLASKGML